MANFFNTSNLLKLKIVLLLFCTHAATAQWNTITPFPKMSVSKVVAPDSLHLRALESGISAFAYSDDGGITWKENIIQNQKYDLSFTDAMNGWISCDSGRVLHTIDGGHTWNNIQLNCNTYLTKIYFRTPYTGYVLPSYADSIFITNDGGSNWSKYKTNIHQYAYPDLILFTDSLHGWITNSNNDPYIYRTTDAGLHWTPDTLPTQMGGMNGISFLDSLHGWILGASALMKTIDGGDTWSIVQSMHSGRIGFIDSLHGIRTDDRERIFNTNDGGITWDTALVIEYNGFNYTTPFVSVDQGLYHVYDFNGSYLKSFNGIDWTFLCWNTFPDYLDLPRLDMGSATKGIFVTPTECTNNSCGNETFYTDNGGRNWHRAPFYSWNTAIQAYSDSCWYFANNYYSPDSSALCKTTDQFGTIQALALFNERINCILFIDSMNGFLGGSDNPYYTSDGGHTWTSATGLSNFDETMWFSFPDATHGFLTTGNKIAKSTDSGRTWHITYNYSPSTYNTKLIFTDTMHGYFNEPSTSIINKSVDGGVGWTDITMPGMISDFYFLDSMHGWVTTDSGIFFTDDGLNSFILQDERYVSSLSIIDPSHCFAAGPQLFLGSDQNSLVNNIYSSGIGSKDMSVYPNPSDGNFTINSQSDFDLIQMEDMTGKIIKQFTGNSKNINLPDLNSGIYLLKCFSKQAIFLNKLIICK